MSTNFLADYITVDQAMVEYNISKSGVMKIVKNYNLELSKVGGQSFMKRTNFEEKMKAELNAVSEKRKIKIANKEKQYKHLKDVNRSIGKYLQTTDVDEVENLLDAVKDASEISDTVIDNKFKTLKSKLVEAVKNSNLSDEDQILSILDNFLIPMLQPQKRGSANRQYSPVSVTEVKNTENPDTTDIPGL